MGSFSIWHWLIVAFVVLILFGRGRISDVMGDFGKGISSFKKGMAEAEKMPDEKPRQIGAPPPEGPNAPVRTPEEEAAARRDPGT